MGQSLGQIARNLDCRHLLGWSTRGWEPPPVAGGAQKQLRFGGISRGQRDGPAGKFHVDCQAGAAEKVRNEFAPSVLSVEGDEFGELTEFAGHPKVVIPQCDALKWNLSVIHDDIAPG
jgi:hypothetical protein